jgi:hypothetical protein
MAVSETFIRMKTWRSACGVSKTWSQRCFRVYKLCQATVFSAPYFSSFRNWVQNSRCLDACSVWILLLETLQKKVTRLMNMAGSSRFSAQDVSKKIMRYLPWLCAFATVLSKLKRISSMCSASSFSKSPIAIGPCRLAPFLLKTSSNLHMLCVRAFSNQVRICSCADSRWFFQYRRINPGVSRFMACGYTLPKTQGTKSMTELYNGCAIFPVFEKFSNQVRIHSCAALRRLFQNRRFDPHMFCSMACGYTLPNNLGCENAHSSVRWLCDLPSVRKGEAQLSGGRHHARYQPVLPNTAYKEAMLWSERCRKNSYGIQCGKGASPKTHACLAWQIEVKIFSCRLGNGK